MIKTPLFYSSIFSLSNITGPCAKNIAFKDRLGPRKLYYMFFDLSIIHFNFKCCFFLQLIFLCVCIGLKQEGNKSTVSFLNCIHIGKDVSIIKMLHEGSNNVGLIRDIIVQNSISDIKRN